MLYELYISSLMKSDLNLRLSCQQLPGSARLARGWCGLKVKGGLLLMLLIVHLWVRPGSSQPWHSIQISSHSSFLSFRKTPIVDHVFILPQPPASASSPQLLSHFTWRRESRYGIQPWNVFISVLLVLQTHLQRTKALNVESFASALHIGVFYWKCILYRSLN